MFNLNSITDLALLLLRLIVAAIFIDSGTRDLQNPAGRAQGMGVSKAFAIFLGSAEIAGGLGLIFGVLIQFAAAGLILIMLGAIQKKAFVWKTGFWGENKMGWHYDLMLLLLNLLFIATAGGRYVLMRF